MQPSYPILILFKEAIDENPNSLVSNMTLDTKLKLVLIALDCIMFTDKAKNFRNSWPKDKQEVKKK